MRHAARGRSGSGFSSLPRTGLLDIGGPWEVLGHANEVLGRAAYELELDRAERARGRDAPRARRERSSAPAPRRRAAARTSRSWRAARPAIPLPDGEARLAAWLRRHHARHPHDRLDLHGRLRAGRSGVARRTPRHDPLAASRLTCARGSPRRSVVDEGIFVRDDGVWTSAGLTAGIDLTLALVEEDHGHARRDGRREAARAVPAPVRESGAVQLGAPAAREGAAQAARHLDVRPRARRRGAARGAHRRRGRDEPAHAQPLVPRAPRRIARRARAPPSRRRGPAAARGDVAAL